MGGSIIVTKEDIPGCNGRVRGEGKAVMGTTEITVYNPFGGTIPVGTKCMVRHEAGGKWTIARIETP